MTIDLNAGPDLIREIPDVPYSSIERRSDGTTVAFVCKSKITNKTTNQSWMDECDTHYVEKELYDTLKGLCNKHTFAAICRFDSLSINDSDSISCPPDIICLRIISSVNSRRERIKATIVKQLKGDCLPIYTDSIFTFYHCDPSTFRPFLGKSVLAFFDSGNVFSTIRLPGQCSRESAIFLYGDSIVWQNGGYFDSTHVSLQQLLKNVGVNSAVINSKSLGLSNQFPLRIWEEKQFIRFESSTPIAKVCVCQINGRIVTKMHPAGALQAEIPLANKGNGILYAEISLTNGLTQRCILNGFNRK
jgi:hypothetical protein